MSDDRTWKRREQDLSDLGEFSLEDLLKQLQEKGGNNHYGSPCWLNANRPQKA